MSGGGGLRRLEVELRADSWKTKSDEGRGNFGRRSEGGFGNVKNKFGPAVKLGEDGEITVVAGARLGGEPESDFGLDDDVEFVYDGGESEKMLEDGRSDVVGKIAVDESAAACGDGGDIGGEDVDGKNGEIGMTLCEAFEASD